MNNSGSSPFLSIQYLRAIAALCVVSFHEATHLGGGASWNIGNVGVDLFFVISGFIMHVVTETKEAAPKQFLKRRVARIVPLYWCVTMVTMAILMFAPGFMGEHSTFPYDRIVQSFLFVGDGRPIIWQGWTLNIEVFFYAVVAGALFVPRRFQLPLISSFLVLVIFTGLFLNRHIQLVKTYTDTLLVEFVGGLWIGHFTTRGRLPGVRVGLAFLCVGTLVLMLDPLYGYHGKLFRPIIWGVPAALIVLGSLSIEQGGVLPRLPLVALIGDASYSIYLLHEIAEATTNGLTLPLVPKAMLSITTAVIAGVVVSIWFEKPLNRIVRGFLEGEPQAN